MATEAGTPNPELNALFAQLTEPFDPSEIKWRVTHTTRDGSRGAVIPFADPRAYSDRLNHVFTPSGWIRTHEVNTVSSLTRMKKDKLIQTGKVRAIATSGATRSPALPALPTLEESGVAGYEYAPWYGMFGPATLPKPVVARLNQTVNGIIREPAIRDQFARQGLEVQTLTSEQFGEILRSDVAKWGKIIRDAGVRAN